MTYNKPEVVKLDSAISMIQSQGPQKPNGDVIDSPFLNHVTETAYEADE